MRNTCPNVLRPFVRMPLGGRSVNEFHKEEIATHMDDMLVCSHNARSAHELLEQLLEEWLKHQEEHHGDK